MSKVLPYPLYDQLLKEVKERTETGIDISKVSDTIGAISKNSPSDVANKHYREIAMLIMYHEIVNNPDTQIFSQKVPVPFDGKVMAGGRGILYHIVNLPPIVQQIIAQYIEVASKK